MAVKVFDNGAIGNPLLKHINKSTLQEVSDRDYPCKYKFKPGVECLDMDTYETAACGGEKGATVDSVVGIADYTDNRKVSPRLLYVELRMDYDSVNNLSAGKLKAKVANTQSRIGREVAEEQDKYFVFKDSRTSLFSSWFVRQQKAHAIPDTYMPMSVRDFNEAVCLPSEMPYTYKENRQSISCCLAKAVASNNEDDIIAKFDYWAKKANSYDYRNNRQEANAIKDVMKEEWRKYKFDVSSVPYDKPQVVELLESEHSFLG